MTAPAKPLPCPFCGDRDKAWRESIISLAEATDSLEIRGFGLAVIVRMEAIAAWNRRAPQEER